MAGVLRLPLSFQSDAELAVDFALTRAGVALDLTGAQLRLAFALRRATGGFVLTVGQGILTPGAAGLVQARVAAADMAARIGDYDLSLQVLLPADDWVTWAIGRASVVQGAYARAEGAAPLNTGLDGSGAVTIAVDWTGSVITVDATPGVQGPPSTQDWVLGFSGTFDASELLNVTKFGRDFAFAPGSSVAWLNTAPTSEFVISILKNGVAFALATWSPGQHAGAVSCSAPTIAPGDLIEWVAPNPQDATAADASVYLVSNP